MSRENVWLDSIAIVAPPTREPHATRNQTCDQRTSLIGCQRAGRQLAAHLRRSLAIRDRTVTDARPRQPRSVRPSACAIAGAGFGVAGELDCAKASLAGSVPVALMPSSRTGEI